MAGSATITGTQHYFLGIGHPKFENAFEAFPVVGVSQIMIVPTSRSLTADDFEKELSLASAVALTIPTDTVLGITDATYSPTVAMYCAGATPFTLVTTGLTMRGTAPTIAQYGWYGIKRVGANEWAYL